MHEPTAKPFSWSYSRLKNFETCPKRHYEVDIAKNVKEGESEQLKWGNTVHKALAARLSGGSMNAITGEVTRPPLPKGMEPYEHWIEKILAGEGDIKVEQQLAITKDYAPTGWFDKDAWFRSIADVIKNNGDVALVIDWKTGKLLDDSYQLALMAACVFAHNPAIMAIRSEFVWLKEDASTREDFKRSDMPQLWRNVWPRIEGLENAWNGQVYPAKPGNLCRRWCPVTSCQHHGK